MENIMIRIWRTPCTISDDFIIIILGISHLKSESLTHGGSLSFINFGYEVHSKIVYEKNRRQNRNVFVLLVRYIFCIFFSSCCRILFRTHNNGVFSTKKSLTSSRPRIGYAAASGPTALPT